MTVIRRDEVVACLRLQLVVRRINLTYTQLKYLSLVVFVVEQVEDADS